MPPIYHGGGGEDTNAAKSAPRQKVISAPHTSAPRLEFSTERLDLGDGKPNEILRGELTLTNRSAGGAKFSLIKHCGCTELSPLSGELAPGESETINVGVQLPGHANSEKTTSVEVQADDLAEVVGRCVLAARCPAPFKVEPAYISFGSLTVDELGTAFRELRLDSLGGQPAINPDAVSIEHANDSFDVCLVDTVPHGGRCGQAVVRVVPRQDLPGGEQFDTLNIHSRGSDYGIRVPVRLNIVEPIVAVPGTVFLRRNSDDRAFRPIRVLVEARASGDLSAPISVASAPPGFSVADLGEIGDRRRQITVSVSGSGVGWPREVLVSLEAGRGGRRFGIKLVNTSK